MFRIVFYYAVLCPSFFALVFSACLMWRSSSLGVEIKNTPEAKLSELTEYPVLISKPIKSFLSKASSETNIDPDVLLGSLELYLDRNPLDADVWLVGSKIYQQSGDYKLALLYLSVAHSLSESNTPVLLKVFNRYLELNLIDQAMPVAHDIAIAKPHEFRRLFYLMSRLSNDYISLVDKVIPKQLLDKKLINNNTSSIKNVYLQWAMVDSIRASNDSLAKEVWAVTPDNEKLNNDIGVGYLNYLSKFQKLSVFKSVWSDVSGANLVSGELLNYTGEKHSPCWYIRPNVNVEIDVFDAENGAVLKVDFLGKDNVHYDHLRCLVPVVPETKYRLTGRYKSKNISTLSGPFLDVHFPGVSGVVNRTEGIIGSSSWLGFNMDFEVPDNINFVEFRIRRNATQLLDSKISGTVWFDSFKLSLIE